RTAFEPSGTATASSEAAAALTLNAARLAAEILVLWHEPARDERRALWVPDDSHPDPGGVERRDDHLPAEIGGLRSRSVGVVDREGHAPMCMRIGLVAGDWIDSRHDVLES